MRVSPSSITWTRPEIRSSPGDDASLLRELSEVGGELEARADGVVLRGLRRVQLVHLHDVGGPRSEEMMVGLGDAEHLRDHDHGQRLRERGQQVELPRAGHRLEQPLEDRVHPRAEGLDEPGSERLRHEPAHACVIRRLHVEDPGVDQVPERRVPVGRGRAAHLLVGGGVQVRAAEAPIPQQGVDVGVPGDQPVVGRLVVDDGRGSAELLVVAIGVRDEPDVGGRETHRTGR